ncbi:maltokinase N-terminal cap-like domain-containing protein [Nocardioides dilutus]
MAFLHNATLVPTKKQLLTAWLPDQPWFTSVEWDPVGSFRLDDPDGEVGMEGFLLGRADGGLFVPVTYRGAPLEGAEEHLVGTTEHSALGTRWVYDAWGDPVWRAAVAETIRSGGTQAVEENEQEDGRIVLREPSATVRGSGPAADGVLADELVFTRVLGEPLDAPLTLTATWAGGTAVVAGLL